jgi:hypothetical protein
MRRIMYVENKSGGLDGGGRIGWVGTTRTGRTYLYGGRRLMKTAGYKYNCIDAETREAFWVSGPHKDGADKLYGGTVQIDEDARVDYWTQVRGRPDLVACTEYRAGASSRTGGATRRNEERVGGARHSRERGRDTAPR